MLDSPLNIVLIGVCIIAVLYLIYRMFFDKPTTTPQITTKAASYDAAAVQQGLTAAGVNTTQENFEATTNSTTLVLDTADKFNKNFTYFMTTFIKMINMDNVNKYIEGNGIKKTTTQIETEKNIDFLNIFSGILNLIIDIIYLAGTMTDKLLIGLATLIGSNIQMKTNTSNPYTVYYMNDIDTVGDMYLYIVPDSDTRDRTKLNTDTDILDYLESNMKDLTKTYKVSLFKLIEKFIFNKINAESLKTTETTLEITTSSKIYIDYTNKIIRNKINLIHMTELYIACIYCYYDNPTSFTANSPIIDTIKTFITSVASEIKPTDFINNNYNVYKNFKSQFRIYEQNSSDYLSYISINKVQSSELTSYTGDYITLYTEANQLGTSIIYKLNNTPFNNGSPPLILFDYNKDKETIRSFTITNRTGTTYNIYGRYAASDSIASNIVLQPPFNNIPQTTQINIPSGKQETRYLIHIYINKN
jgi:hypothetical protein